MARKTSLKLPHECSKSKLWELPALTGKWFIAEKIGKNHVRILYCHRQKQRVCDKLAIMRGTKDLIFGAGPDDKNRSYILVAA